MSRETDHSDGPSTLPAAELNPLLNPILGQHMGRWAEVYFTSPPEKREQAVLELLRELEASDSPRDEASIPAPPSSITAQALEPVVGSQIGEVRPAPVRCHSCGGENPPSHRFCGMCGTPMGDQEMEIDVQPPDLHRVELPVADRHGADPPEPELAAFVPSLESQSAYEPIPDTKNFPLFRVGRDIDDLDDDPSASFAPSLDFGSYRVYVGIVLATVIFVLAYMAWHGSQATSQMAQPVPPPVEKGPTLAAPTPANTPDTTRSANSQPSQPAQEILRNEPGTKVGLDRAAPPAPLVAPPSENNPQSETLAGGGEELATAQRYLNGTAGAARNGAEAAKWLWKAIAKHNSTATVLLADLYLKGDGVEKNCDQARVLLDSAALKGAKEAAERLRHLQAFGCQ